MAQHCNVVMPDGMKCYGTSHAVIRPTVGGPRGVICHRHQQALARGETLYRWGGWRFLLPVASRTRARIMRGG